MKKRLLVLTAVAALGLGGAVSPATAAERVAQEEETTTDDEEGTDYGWIGLLGLAGLAGLLGRNRRRDDTVARVRPDDDAVRVRSE